MAASTWKVDISADQTQVAAKVPPNSIKLNHLSDWNIKAEIFDKESHLGATAAKQNGNKKVPTICIFREDFDIPSM